VFSIRPPRGKGATSQQTLAPHPDELKQSVLELSKRVTETEKKNEEGRLELLTMISVLQVQIKELKDKVLKP
jgi:hypothetical protein